MRLALTALICLAMPAYAEPIDPGQIKVKDADTIRVVGHDRNTRLVGFNAPEIKHRARCDKGRELGEKAAARLQELINGGALDLEMVPCATKAQNYNRFCGRLTTHGVDVGQMLIWEDLAVPFVCGATSCPKTPRPWCE